MGKLTRADHAAIIEGIRALEAELGLEEAPARPAPPPRPARLLLLGCSATKSDAAGLLPIRQRYRGPLWLTLGAADAGSELAQAIAVSAEFGFIPDWHAIPAYEARLSAEAGAELAGQIERGAPGINYRARGAERRRHALALLALTAGASIADAARKAGRPIEAVALCGGAAYLAPMRAAVALGIRKGWIAPGAEITTINATIGLMRRGLRQWIEAGREPPAPALAAIETPIAASIVAELDAPAAGRGHNGGPALEEERPSLAEAQARPDIQRRPAFLARYAGPGAPLRPIVWEGGPGSMGQWVLLACGHQRDVRDRLTRQALGFAVTRQARCGLCREGIAPAPGDLADARRFVAELATAPRLTPTPPPRPAPPASPAPPPPPPPPPAPASGHVAALRQAEAAASRRIAALALAAARAGNPPWREGMALSPIIAILAPRAPELARLSAKRARIRQALAAAEGAARV